MWRDISELPKGEGAYIVWMSEPQFGGEHIAVMYVKRASNGYLSIINNLFEWDVDGKPLLFQTIVAPNFIPSSEE